MYTVAERDALRDRVLALARADDRVVAGALLGSLTEGGDRWSDLDLSFGVDGPVEPVLDDFTRALEHEDATRLFDVRAGSTIYRVFLLPGCLQLDLSLTPATEFGARGPKFHVLFGEAVELPHAPPPDEQELFGYAVHHALRARFSIERGRVWHAEYWISSLRDYALAIACRRRGLPAVYGRGFDDLPAEVLARFEDAIVRSLERDELRRALWWAIDGLLREAGELAARVEPQLRELAS